MSFGRTGFRATRTGLPAYLATQGSWQFDAAILEDARARLDALRLFDLVQIGRAGELPMPATASRAAFVTLERFDETAFSAATVHHVARLCVDVRVRESEPGHRMLTTDRLVGACCDALNGQSLARLSIAETTHAQRGASSRRKDARPPESSYEITVEAPYFLPRVNGHRTL